MTITSDPASLLASAAVPAFKCPKGTKMHILDLGSLEADESWIFRGANTSKLSNLNPTNQRRELVLISALIEHPDAGLILYDVGCAEDLEVAWPAPVTDVFPRVKYSDEQKLPNAIKATGNDIKDVKAVIIKEFKHACWAIAAKADLGVYQGHYMLLEKLNWQTFTESQLELYQGITLHHTPGHAPGLCMMQVNLDHDGTFIWTTDQYHVAENYELGHPHGGLARDHNAWYRSLNMTRRLQRLFNARLIYGHDKPTTLKLLEEKKFFE
ncbi:uncharacterized protein N7469_007892 [Penicillium citrinum]|uniref:Metallo-beta-lactamase domain-containing protein n=2 Tax=Penicillium TaxID=5073 RepID=A0A9W9TJ32_PENCI|nr:uncharacterized protein N7469_007892 [Penicillium citrinum]KAJ5224389.1 hypothetical protein N7469_007892 [Penicillium citrinum]KAJ5574641.1 hypothetical protein N7450_008540 [Penicillium hetheringtonii]